MQRSRALGLLAAAPLAMPARLSAQARTIRFGSAINDSYAQAFFATDEGFFAKANLNVDVQTFANAPSIVQAVVGNALDVGVADPIQLGNAFIHGIPLAFFAGGGLYRSSAPTTLLCASATGTIRSVKDLAGQSIAIIALSSTGATSLRVLLQQNGVDPAQVKFFELPFASMAAALQRGTVAAALIAEPFLSQEKASFRFIGDPQSVIGKDFYVASTFATRSWITQNRPLAQTLAQTLYATARWSNTHHDDSAVILSKYTKLEVATIKAMTRVEYATALEPRLIQPVLDFAYKVGSLTAPVKATDITMSA